MMRLFNPPPPQAHSVHATPPSPQPRHNRQRERAVDQTFPELRAFTVLVIEMNLVGVVGEEGKPDVVVLSDGSSETATINIANLEIFEITALPTGLDRHGILRS